jgi:uncharacterized protein YlaI
MKKLARNDCGKPLVSEILPFCLHGKAPRTFIKDSEWRKISAKTREVNKCCICGEETTSLDAHELYSYDLKTKIIKLEKLLPLCKDCHNTIHIGRVRIMISQGTYPYDEIERLENRCKELFGKYEEDTTFFNEVNSSDGWKLDLSLLGVEELKKL